MIKQCSSCGRYFHDESDELCERCRKTTPKKSYNESRRECACGKMFAPFDEEDYSCPACKRAIFDDMTESERNKIYLDVRDFLYTNPLTPKVRISERFGVPMRFIDDWIHHGKIQQIDEVELRGGVPTENTCQFCGVKIHKGSICKPCEARMSDKLESHHIATEKAPSRGKVITKR